MTPLHRTLVIRAVSRKYVQDRFPSHLTRRAVAHIIDRSQSYLHHVRGLLPRALSLRNQTASLGWLGMRLSSNFRIAWSLYRRTGLERQGQSDIAGLHPIAWCSYPLPSAAKKRDVAKRVNLDDVVEDAEEKVSCHVPDSFWTP